MPLQPAKLYQDSLRNQITSALALAETLHGLYSGSASSSQQAASIPQTIAPTALTLARPAPPPPQAQAPTQSYPPVPPAAQAPAPPAVPPQQLNRSISNGAQAYPASIAGPSSAPRNMAPPPVPTPLPANQAGSRLATAAPPTPFVAPSTPASASHPARPPSAQIRDPRMQPPPPTRGSSRRQAEISSPPRIPMRRCSSAPQCSSHAPPLCSRVRRSCSSSELLSFRREVQSCSRQAHP